MDESELLTPHEMEAVAQATVIVLESMAGELRRAEP